MAVAPARKSWSDLPTLLERLPDLARFAEKRLAAELAGDLTPAQLGQLERRLFRAARATAELAAVLYEASDAIAARTWPTRRASLLAACQRRRRELAQERAR